MAVLKTVELPDCPLPVGEVFGLEEAGEVAGGGVDEIRFAPHWSQYFEPSGLLNPQEEHRFIALCIRQLRL
jgi:hypothetical protein